MKHLILSLSVLLLASCTFQGHFGENEDEGEDEITSKIIKGSDGCNYVQWTYNSKNASRDEKIAMSLAGVQDIPKCSTQKQKPPWGNEGVTSYLVPNFPSIEVLEEIYGKK